MKLIHDLNNLRYIRTKLKEFVINREQFSAKFLHLNDI